jgi:hypothetical protein
LARHPPAGRPRPSFLGSIFMSRGGSLRSPAPPGSLDGREYAVDDVSELGSKCGGERRRESVCVLWSSVSGVSVVEKQLRKVTRKEKKSDTAARCSKFVLGLPYQTIRVPTFSHSFSATNNHVTVSFFFLQQERIQSYAI